MNGSRWNDRPSAGAGNCRRALALTMFALLGAASALPARAAEPTPYFNGFESDLTGWFTTGSPLTIAASGTGGITSAAGGFHAQPTSGQYTRYAPATVTNEFPADGYSVRLDVYLNLAGGYANDTRFDWSSAYNKDNGVNFGRDFIFNGGFYDDAVAPGSGPRFVVSASNNAPGWPKNPANGPFVISSSGWYTFKHRFYNNGSGILAVDLSILDSSGNALKTWTISNPSDLAGPNDVDPRYGWIVTNQSAPGVQATVAGTGVIAAFDNTRLRFNQPAVALTTGSPALVGTTQTLFGSGGAGTGAFVYSVGASTACSVAGDQLTIASLGSCAVTVTRAGDDNYEPSAASAPVTVVVTDDLEDATTGQTINGQTAKNVPYGTHVYGSTWTVVDEWATGRLTTVSTADDYDERVVDDGTGNIVWRLSNAVTSSGYSDQPVSASAPLPAGDTGSSLWNDRGPNNAAPTGPAFRANAATKYLSASLDFKSATGAPQSGLNVVLSAQPRQTNIRLTWLKISDSGSGFTLDFNDVQAGGSFVQTTIATGLSYADWHNIEMFHEFVDGLNMDGSGNDIVKIVVDGVVVHTGTTWEGYYPSVGTKVYAADAVLFRVAGTAAPGTAGNGFFFDNVAIDNQPYRLTQPALTVNASSPVAIGSTQTLTTSGGAGTGAVAYSVGSSADCSVVGDQLTVNAGGDCTVTAAKAGDDDYKPSATSAPVAVATLTNLVVNPITPVFSANNVTGVQADAAPGFASGSLQSNGVAKTDLYLTPAMLFGGSVALEDIESVRYWTRKGTTHAVNPADWFLAIYTQPFPGDVSTPGWYGDRIGSEPYFSASMADPVNTWNQWASDGASNTLRFFQSTQGAPGATLGSYTDPHWDTFVTGNSTGTAIPLAGHSVLYFSVQTGNPWAVGFTGQLDGLRIELTDGSVATVNFEFQCTTDAQCDTGPCATDTCNVANGTCSSVMLPSSTQCRVSVGDCDPAENCTGASENCPADVLEPSSTECRASDGDCDVAENCTGGDADCPADGFVAGGTQCRASAGICDVAESCTGSVALCPSNGFVAGGTPCSDGSECTTADTCSGSGAACVGGPAPDCDDTNVCTDDSCNPSTTGGCEHVDNTDPCDDGLFCTIGDVCSGGACAGPDPRSCSADNDPSDFETPTCSLGSINGQDSWMKTGPFDHAVSSSGGAAGFGAQSLRISNAVTSGSFGDQTFSKPVVNEVGESDAIGGGLSGGSRRTILETEFDIVSAVPGAQQAGLNFSTSADRGDGARMTYLRFVDSASGIQVFFDDYQDISPYGSVGDEISGCSGSDDWFETQVGPTLDRSIPHTIREVLEVVDGPRNDTVAIYVDGVLLHTGTSWEDYFRWCAESGAGGVSRTVDSRLFRTAGTAAPATAGLGFLIDNFTLTSGTTEGSVCGDTCNEADDNCLTPSGTSCTDDSNPCTIDQCDGLGSCDHDAGNPGTVCRTGSGDMCDPTETCTGEDTACPAEVLLPNTEICNPGSGDLCDVDQLCTGTAGQACPADVVATSGTVCRAGSGDMCDPDEECTGVAEVPCPSEVLESSGTLCRAGSGDMCDPNEVCTGVATAACPTNVVLPNTAVCNAGSGDLCDVDQFCIGTAGQACPADVVAASGTLCRAGSGDMCDPTEVCTGVANAACPADVVLANTTVCRAGSGDMCNPTETCTGVATAACPGDSFLPSNAVCRADTGDCDVVENCPGTPAACPADAFEPSNTLCTDDGDECTRDRCDGANACLHPPIVLAQACNWLIVGESSSRSVRARTRFGTTVVGDICADKGEIGEQSHTAGDSVWAVLGLDVKAVKVRPDAVMEDLSCVVTAGGCVSGLKDFQVFDTGMPSICCGHGEIALSGGGIVHTCGTDSRVDDCETAKGQVAPDVALLNGLPGTQDLGPLDCSDTAPCVIEAVAGLNVIDIARMKVADNGVVTIDANGNADAVIVLRIERGLTAKGQTTFELVGGAQAQNVLFYAKAGKCDFGNKTVGAGTLFCPAGKVRMQLQSEWDGALVGGRNIDLGDNSFIVHVPFTGLAD